MCKPHTQLPEVSVDALEVAWPNTPACPSWAELTDRATSSSSSNSSNDGCPLPLPTITLSFHASDTPDAVYVASNASSPWPLQVGGQVDGWLEQEGRGDNLQELRDFFDALRSVTFDFAVRSRGWGGDGLHADTETCILVRLTAMKFE